MNLPHPNRPRKRMFQLLKENLYHPLTVDSTHQNLPTEGYNVAAHILNKSIFYLANER